MRNRLRLVSLTFAFVVATACWTLAQTYGTESQEHSQGQMAGHDQEQMEGQKAGHEGMRINSAQDRLDWFSRRLNLTADQKTKLLPILQSENQQMKAVVDNSSLTQDQRHDQIVKIHQSTDPQIESVLTPEQRQKFAQLKEQGKERHEGAMEEEKEQKR